MKVKIMNKLEEYKNRIQWDIWEDIQRVKDAPEELPHENPNIPIFTHTLKRYKKT
jgi:hypothetical protein